MNEDQKLYALQSEYDEILVCIKPIYLNWKVSSEKSLIAAWIRKLSNMNVFTVDTMHLRNLYILALFDSMRKEILPDPFKNIPPHNDLLPLPIHLKEIIENFSIKSSFNPDWLDSELFKTKDIMFDDNTNDLEEEGVGSKKYPQGSADVKQNLFTSVGVISQNKASEYHHEGAVTVDSYRYPSVDQNWGQYNTLRNNVHNFNMRDTDGNIIGDCEPYSHISDTIENYEDIRSKQKVNEQGFSGKVSEKEMLLNNITGMEKRLAQLQNSYHEDIMKLRSQHDLEIQSLINRKNLEMEQTRKDFNDKIIEQEYHMDQLESKANECIKQLQLFQENKLKEVEQLKKNHNEILEEQSRHNEQKIVLLYEDFQKEKNALISEQKKKEDAIHKETQDYFSKIKTDFVEKSNKTNKEISNLEKDTEELKIFKKRIMEQNEYLSCDNQKLSLEIKKLQIDLDESIRRYQFIDNQQNRLLQTHNQEVKCMKETFESTLHNIECAKDELEIKAHDKTTMLEREVERLEKLISELKKNNKNELETIELNYHSEKIKIKQSYENELDILKSQLKYVQVQSENKISEFEKKLQLKDDKINELEKDLVLKDKTSSQMIEDLHQEMTLNSERQLRKKQFEHEQIESDLKYELHDKSKEVTDLMQQLSCHKQETEIKLGEIRKWSDNQISVLTLEWKQEKNSIEQKYQIQIQKLEGEFKNKLKKNIEENEIKIKELLNEIEGLKTYIHDQKNEFEEIIKLNKKETVNLVRSHEEENEKLNLNNHLIVENLNKEMIDLKLNMENKHSDQVSQILSKTNEKLKEIEQEYGERSLQSFKMINDLKSMIEKLKKENQDQKNYNEEQLNHLVKKCQSEIENYQRIIKTNLETYKKEIINEQLKSKQAEKLLEKKDQNAKRQLNQLKVEFEMKISKLLPIDLQNDFEETIQSLRCQISFLQQRINILEDEVESVNIYKSVSNNGFLKQKCDNIFEE